MNDTIEPLCKVEVVALDSHVGARRFNMVARLDSEVEVDYYRNGDILPFVLRGFLRWARRPDIRFAGRRRKGENNI